MARVSLDGDTRDHRRLTLRFLKRHLPPLVEDRALGSRPGPTRLGNNQPTRPVGVLRLLDEAREIQNEHARLQQRMEQLCDQLEELLT
jgi:hypothetical protein